jgi:6-phosphogluconate dehydrogenase (decarboxylating)
MANLNHPKVTESAPSKPQAASIGIVGLGRMGQVFGELLIGSGAHVMAYDRDAARVQALAQERCSSCLGPSRLCRVRHRAYIVAGR